VSPSGEPPGDVRSRVDALNASALALRDTEPRSALEKAEEARDLAQGIGYDAGLGAALSSSALLHGILGNFEAAYAHALQAHDLYLAAGDVLGEVRAMTTLGRVEFASGNTAAALAHLFPALELAQENRDLEAEAGALYELSCGHVLLDEHARALEFAQRAILLDRQIGDRRAEARELNVVAICQRELGSFEEAAASALESRRIARDEGAGLIESLALGTLCEIAEQTGDYDQSIVYCRETLALGRELGNAAPQLAGLTGLGNAYRQLGEIARSREHYESGLVLATRVDDRKSMLTCHRALSELHELEGDLVAALEHERVYGDIREALFDEAHDRRAEALEARHRAETARKEAEIYQLRSVELEKEIADRTAAEDELRAYKEYLDELVAERTRELTVAYKRLQASEERYRTIYEDTPSMYFTVDPAGTVLAVNAFGAKQLGYLPTELIGEPVLKVFVPEDAAAAAAQVQNCLAHPGRVFHWELRKLRKDGSKLNVRETARVSERDGQPVVLIVCEDITEQKRAQEAHARLEAELRQGQKLEAIGRLAGGVAHDFNNLLTVMIGYIDLVVGALGPDSPTRQDAEEARRAAERAATLTRQLLAFSRQQPIRLAAVDLNEVVREMQRMLERLIGEDVVLQINLDPQLRPVHADRGQLEQVILNLATNARDAMPSGGTLRIATANSELQPQRQSTRMGYAGSFALLTVTDSGVGMDEDTRARIYEPFFTTKERTGGTGLGLSTVYGIVEQHHGRVAVTDAPAGRGTEFRIWLPHSVEIATQPSSPPARPAERGTETILLVEDEEMVRSLAARVLRDRGYLVLEAHNAEEALALADEHHGEIDLTVSDVVMPGINGRKLAELLRRREPGIRLVLMSGYHKVFDEGAPVLPPDVGVLSKPFTGHELLRVVRTALDQPATSGRPVAENR
jgi:two-component system, cell cycle sensor histidine kinase and response regulator CckA